MSASPSAVAPLSAASPVPAAGGSGTGNELAGFVFHVAGRFSMVKAEFEAVLRSHGGVIKKGGLGTGSVVTATHLVVGKGGEESAKGREAVTLGIIVIDEAALTALIGREAAPTTTKKKKQKTKKRGAKEGGQSSAGDDEPPKKKNKTQSELLMQVAGSRLNFYDIKRTTTSTGRIYVSCSCPSWRNKYGAPEGRRCKHLIANGF